jgi:DNA-binding GntR family transcriptional regulator
MVDDSSIATLVERIKGRAAQLRPGDALPSTRVLIEEYRVSPVTVSRALSVLVAEGLVVTRPGAGTYVTGRRSQTPTNEADLAWQAMPLSDRTVDTSRLASLVQPPPEGVISLASGYPGADLVPTRPLVSPGCAGGLPAVSGGRSNRITW